jgi:hypothetical protein
MGSSKQKNSLISLPDCLIYLLILVLLSAGCTDAGKKTPFIFKENKQGIELFENGKSVFFYQREPKSLTGEYICNNYIHPLYSLGGDTITEEFPPDHPYHRGVFWAWHQLYIDSTSLGDGWVMDKITQDVTDVLINTDRKKASLSLNVLWKSSVYSNNKPFINEHTGITIYRLKSGIRMIDFTITLDALVPQISIGGSDDEKGYGGFCVRSKLPDDLVFTSENGKVTPEVNQINAGSWMDFSASFGKSGKTGFTIFCHPGTPNYPAPWILRQSGSMQNVVFPGRERLKLTMNKPVELRYRLIIHNGTARDLDIARLQEAYGK